MILLEFVAHSGRKTMSRRIDIGTGTKIALCLVAAGTAVGMMSVGKLPDGSLDLNNIKIGLIGGLIVAVIWIVSIPFLNNKMAKR